MYSSFMSESVMAPLLISLIWEESNMGLCNYFYSTASKSTKLYSCFFLIVDLCLNGAKCIPSFFYESGINYIKPSEGLLLL